MQDWTRRWGGSYGGGGGSSSQPERWGRCGGAAPPLLPTVYPGIWGGEGAALGSGLAGRRRKAAGQMKAGPPPSVSPVKISKFIIYNLFFNFFFYTHPQEKGSAKARSGPAAAEHPAAGSAPGRGNAPSSGQKKKTQNIQTTPHPPPQNETCRGTRGIGGEVEEVLCEPWGRGVRGKKENRNKKIRREETRGKKR